MQIRMDTLVFKVGGSVIAAPGDFAPIAEYLVGKQRDGSRVAVVLSAMSGWTDQLRGFAQLIHPEALKDPQLRAHADAAITAGEKVATGLMALAIHKAGGQAAAFEGHQIGLRTSGEPGHAAIEAIEGVDVLEQAVDAGRIACVAGYQVVDAQNRTLTLSRGGTDESAVAVAYGLGARECILFKDVPGVCPVSPKLVPNARVLPRLSYSQMRQLHAKVVMDEALRLAERHLVRLRVQLAPNIVRDKDEPRPEGTLIGYPDLQPGRLAPPEDPLVFLRVRENLTRIELSADEIPRRLPMQIYQAARDTSVNLVQVRASRHDVVLFVEAPDAARMNEAVRRLDVSDFRVGALPIEMEEGYATITLGDENMLDEPGYMERVAGVLVRLQEEGMETVDDRNVWGVDDRIMPIVRQDDVGRVAQALADEFGLTTDEEVRE